MLVAARKVGSARHVVHNHTRQQAARLHQAVPQTAIAQALGPQVWQDRDIPEVEEPVYDSHSATSRLPNAPRLSHRAAHSKGSASRQSRSICQPGGAYGTRS